MENSHTESSRPTNDALSNSLQSFDIIMYEYHSAIPFLFYPQLFLPEPNQKYIQKCADACTGICSTHKRLHSEYAMGFSKMTMQSVFIARLVLLYTGWLSPSSEFRLRTANGISSCSIVLHVMAE
jgi:hypothetical protein